MYKKMLIAVAAAAAVATSASAQQRGSAAGIIPVLPTTSAYLPPGMMVVATLDDNLSTANREGEGVNLTVSENVMAKDGSVAIPAGTMLQGRLTGVHNSQNAGDPNVVRVNFDDLALKGKHYHFMGTVISIQPKDHPTGSPLGNVLSSQDAKKLVSKGMLPPGTGTVITMAPPQVKGDGIIPAGSVFTVRLVSGIPVK